MVLFLVDALGYAWLREHGRGSYLLERLEGSVTSVFPSSTATAITAFSTGLAASQHGLLGWNMWSPEIGGVVRILPWQHRFTGVPLGDKLSLADLTASAPFYPDASPHVAMTVVTNDAFRDSRYNGHYNVGAKVLGYADMTGCFDRVVQAVSGSAGRNYVYAYWGGFDTLCHNHGNGSPEALAHFLEIDAQFRALEKKLSGTGTMVVVTADHGQIDVPPSRRVDVGREHPALADMLLVPMCGEARYQYCFVRQGRAREFRSYVEAHLGHACAIYSREEVISMRLFGWENSEKFLGRLGDFLLVAKDDWGLFHEPVGGEAPDFGQHGGLHEREVLVPLIAFSC